MHIGCTGPDGCTDLPFCPWQHGEGWLERIFGQVRAGHGIQRSVSTTTLRERLRRAAFRIRAQLTSGLRTRNRRNKRLDVEVRRERVSASRRFRRCARISAVL